MPRTGVDQLGELLEDLHHLVGTLAACHHDDDIGISLLRNSVLEHRLAGTERPGNKTRTALGHRIEGVDGTNARLHHTRGARLLDVAAHGLLHRPFLHHRDPVLPAFVVRHHGNRVRNLIFPCRNDALDRIIAGHRERHHDLVAHPLLLDLAQPRCGRDLVARLRQRGELPFGREIDRVGDRTARDEQAVHLFEVVLQTVVVARQEARSERHFEHMPLELDPVADLQPPGAVKNLDIGAVAYDLDDLGHHFGIPRIHVADFVLAHGSVGLDDHDIGDDTIYTSCSFHELSYCLFSISPLPSSSAIKRSNISRPRTASSCVQRATMLTRDRYDRMELMSK